MAFAEVGSLGATGSTSNNQTVLDLTTTATAAAGTLVVVVMGTDNIANGGDDNAVSGVTLGVGGLALNKGVQIANALAAQAGASCSVWWVVTPTAFTSGGTIRATFGSGTLVDASAMTTRNFTVGPRCSVAVEGTPGTLVNNTGADPASLNVTTANIACLRVRGIASQVGNNTNLTNTASWTPWANGNSATSGTVAEICARAEHIISTGTGSASDPTYVSAIYASVYLALKEIPLAFPGDFKNPEQPHPLWSLPNVRNWTLENRTLYIPETPTHQPGIVSVWPYADPQWWETRWAQVPGALQTPAAAPEAPPVGQKVTPLPFVPEPLVVSWMRGPAQPAPVEAPTALPGAAMGFPVADPQFAEPRWGWTRNGIMEVAGKPSSAGVWLLPVREAQRDPSWGRGPNLAMFASLPAGKQLTPLPLREAARGELSWVRSGLVMFGKPVGQQLTVLPQRQPVAAASWTARAQQAAAAAVLPAGQQLTVLPARAAKPVEGWTLRWPMLTETVAAPTDLPSAGTGWPLAEARPGFHQWVARSPLSQPAAMPPPSQRDRSLPERLPSRMWYSWVQGFGPAAIVQRAPFQATKLTLQYDRRIHSWAFVGGAIYLPAPEVAVALPGAATGFSVADAKRSVTSDWMGQRPPAAAVVAPEMPVRNVQELPRLAARGDVASFMAPAGAIRIPPVMPPKSDGAWRITRAAERALQQGWSSSIGPMLAGSLVKPPPTMRDMSLPRRVAPLLPQYVQKPFQGMIPADIPPQAGGDIHTTYFGTIRVGTLGVR